MENYQNSRPALYAFQTLQKVEKVKVYHRVDWFGFLKTVFVFSEKLLLFSPFNIMCFFYVFLTKKKKKT